MSSPAGSEAELVALAASLVERALPGEGIEVAVSRNTSTTVRAYRGQVESFTAATNFGVGVRVVVAGRQGFAHAGTFDADVLAATLADARDNMGFAEPDPHVALVEPDGVAPVHQELWNPAVTATSADRKVELALELERATIGRDPRVAAVQSCSYGDAAGEFALVSTTGISVGARATSCWVSTSALAQDGDETQTGYSVDVGRDPELLDLARAGNEAVERATRLLGARPVDSQRVPLLVEPRLAATLLGIVSGTLTGEVVVKGRSPFADRLGVEIASRQLTLVDDPTDARSLAADVFDGEGLACRRNTLIEAGVLRSFLHNGYSGRRAGVRSTASAVRSARSLPGVGVQAMAVEPGSTSWDELLGGLDRGFMVQNFHGLHSGVNAISGDFSVGADGLMIRGGELAEPVREITIASTLQRLLMDIVAVGSEIEWLPSGSGCAALLIGDVSLGGR
ncbi:MAG: TldD/PmbA family protein [Acidimicrobiia bacterium]|nr:TldD/PmbA family protein [Acidimicrobiia bacterium]